jgi:homoserine kinase
MTAKIAKKVCVKVPASTANLGPGFDVLGMALSLYAWIEMSPADVTEIKLYGDNLNGIPTDKSNLIYVVAQQLFAKAGVVIPELAIAMYSDIPLTRGLGSSASAIVGALVAANALLDHRFSKAELLLMATELEKHPDNVGASLFGGIIVAHWDGEQVHHLRLEPPAELEVLVAIPNFQLSTSKAREALPSQYSIQDAVHNIGRASLLVAALAQGQKEMIQHAMRDRLHQPYRAPLIPGMKKVLEQACSHGAIGVALSGAGPTLLTFVEPELSKKTELISFLRNTLQEEGVAAQYIWLQPDLDGAQELTGYSQNSTLIDIIKDVTHR